MLALPAAPTTAPATLAAAHGAASLPGVRWLGLILGLLLIYAAIRAMFGRKR